MQYYSVMGHAVNPLTPSDSYRGRTAPLTSKIAFYVFIQQIQVLNILNMVYTLRFFSTKCSLFHNSNVLVSCIIHILYTGCAKIKKKFRRQKVNINKKHTHIRQDPLHEESVRRRELSLHNTQYSQDRHPCPWRDSKQQCQQRPRGLQDQPLGF